jgi:hypothetical protein
MNNSYSNNSNEDIMEDRCQNTYCQCNNDYNDDCGCGFDDEYNDVFPTNPMLGQSYVPMQYMNKTFKPSVGLKMGTIFPELVSPYMPGQSMEEIAYISATNKIGEGCNKCQ